MVGDIRRAPGRACSSGFGANRGNARDEGSLHRHAAVPRHPGLDQGGAPRSHRPPQAAQPPHRGGGREWWRGQHLRNDRGPADRPACQLCQGAPRSKVNRRRGHEQAGDRHRQRHDRPGPPRLPRCLQVGRGPRGGPESGDGEQGRASQSPPVNPISHRRLRCAGPDQGDRVHSKATRAAPGGFQPRQRTPRPGQPRGPRAFPRATAG
mmetsp:Transcript_67610/g.161390  ORF Transcript_67610/g.161390 Transcript_67610/m.161390 type:complete len:208 (-) Transcript_67610:170-793(-)